MSGQGDLHFRPLSPPKSSPSSAPMLNSPSGHLPAAVGHLSPPRRGDYDYPPYSPSPLQSHLPVVVVDGFPPQPSRTCTSPRTDPLSQIPLQAFVESFGLSEEDQAMFLSWIAQFAISEGDWVLPLKRMIASEQWATAPLPSSTRSDMESILLPVGAGLQRLLLQKLELEDFHDVLSRLQTVTNVPSNAAATHTALQRLALEPSMWEALGINDAKCSLRACFFPPDSLISALFKLGVPPDRIVAVNDKCLSFGVPSEHHRIDELVQLVFARQVEMQVDELGLPPFVTEGVYLPPKESSRIFYALSLHKNLLKAFDALRYLEEFGIDEERNPNNSLVRLQMLLESDKWRSIPLDDESKDLLSHLSDKALIPQAARELSEFLGAFVGLPSDQIEHISELMSPIDDKWPDQFVKLVADGVVNYHRPNEILNALLVYKKRVCMLAYCESPASIMLPCGHYFCADCVRGHVDAKLDENTAVIRCPEIHCNQDIAQPIIRAVLHNPNAHERFETVLASAATNAVPMHWCVNFKVCKFGVDAETFKNGGNKRWVCGSCGTDQCIICNCEWHDDENCEQHQKRVEDQKSADRLSEEHIRQMPTKICPNCKIPKFYDGSACAHVTCSCSFQWYWCCQRPYNANVRSEEQRLHNSLCCSNRWCFRTFKTAQEQRAHTSECKPPAGAIQQTAVAPPAAAPAPAI